MQQQLWGNVRLMTIIYSSDQWLFNITLSTGFVMKIRHVSKVLVLIQIMVLQITTHFLGLCSTRLDY